MNDPHDNVITDRAMLDGALDLSPYVFIDSETTGLDPDRHEIWELALISIDKNGNECSNVWQLPVSLDSADLIALNIGGFFDRYDMGLLDAAAGYPWEGFRLSVMEITRGKHLVGAIPSFDAERLAKLLKAHGGIASWHYHLVDVEALAVGAAAEVLTPPWDSDQLSDLFGVQRDLPEFEKHTALGDARWARALFVAVMESKQ